MIGASAASPYLRRTKTDELHERGGGVIDALATTLLLGSFVLPFGLALAVALLAWRLGAAPHGAAVGLGIAAGLVAGLSATAGWPALPPQGAIDKLPWLALGGGLLGLGTAALPDRKRKLAIVAGLAGAVIWIGWPRLMVPHPEAWVAAALLVAGAGWAVTRLEDAGSAGGALLLVVGAFAAAGISFYGSSYAMAQVIAVLAAAVAGAMAGGGTGAAGLGAAGRLAAAGPLTGLISMLALYTRSATLALLLLLPVFLAGTMLRRVDPMASWADRLSADGRHVTRLGLLLLVALVPACAAVAVAVWRSGPLYF